MASASTAIPWLPRRGLRRPAARGSGLGRTHKVAASSSGFEALYDLSRLAYPGEVEPPNQLDMWPGEADS